MVERRDLVQELKNQLLVLELDECGRIWLRRHMDLCHSVDHEMD